jgi:hypothetical protein
VISVNGLCDSFVVRIDDVVQAVHRLNSGKRDEDSLLTTDHFISAPQE